MARLEAPIWFWSQGPEEWRPLSNFWPCPVPRYDVRRGHRVILYTGASAEHTYQASKAVAKDERDWVLASATPQEAKRRGKQVRLRPEFDPATDMHYTLLAKYGNNPELMELLRSTAPRELVEDQPGPWGGRNGGENRVGKMLMALRDA